MLFVKLSLILLIGQLILVQSIIGFATKGTGSCPLQGTIKTCFPRCLSDFECTGTKRCCRNTCGSMSCVDTVPVYSGNEPQDKKSGVLCGNVRCYPGKKCISDGPMKRPRCS